MHTDVVLESPRLKQLQQELAAGADTPVARFWDEVRESGAPLVEALPNDPDNVLVTFLWRAEAPVENVVLIAQFVAWGLPALVPLAQTDIWFHTRRVPQALRTAYLLSPNDSQIPFSEVKDWAERVRTWQPDPLNPKRFVWPPRDDRDGQMEWSWSLLELPGAPPQPWITAHPERPHAQVTRHRFASPTLGNERNIWVVTPRDYAAQPSAYGLLVVFDGFEYHRVVPVPTILTNLVAEQRIPSLVAVLIDSPDQETRDRELTCNPLFLAFLTQELLPWIRQHYHVTTDPRQTMVAGSSHGGTAALYAAVSHPEIFGMVLSQSGSFWWSPADDPEQEWLARFVATREQMPDGCYLEAGIYEDRANEQRGILQPNRRMRKVLGDKGVTVHYREFCGGHDYCVWRGTFADGLLALLAEH